MYYVQYSSDNETWTRILDNSGHDTLERAKCGAKCVLAFSPRYQYAQVVSRNGKRIYAQYKQVED